MLGQYLSISPSVRSRHISTLCISNKLLYAWVPKAKPPPYPILAIFRVPTGTGKPGKMRQLFPVREKSGNFEKILKSQGILSKSGKTVIHKLKFNQSRIKILLNFFH